MNAPDWSSSIGRPYAEDVVRMAEALSGRDGYERAEEAREEILADALSIEVRSAWTGHGEPLVASEFAVLITTGGPAVRIRGTLGNHGEPDRAWLEVQDWSHPWTEYFGDDPAALAEACLAYARAFCWE